MHHRDGNPDESKKEPGRDCFADKLSPSNDDEHHSIEADE